jgi:hypothetical protein
MNFTALGSGAAMSAYASSLLSSRSDTGSSGTSAATPASTALKAAAAAALDKASHTFKATSAQHSLEQKETALAGDLRSALSASGVKLSGSVEFSIGSDGTLAMTGSDADKQAVGKFLKSDKSQPSFTSRVTTLAGQADALSATIRQNAAISQAARYAGGPSGVMSLYSTLMQQQDSTPAVFTLSASGSSLTYPGGLATAA